VSCFYKLLENFFSSLLAEYLLHFNSFFDQNNNFKFKTYNISLKLK